MEARGALPPKLKALKDDLERIRTAAAAERTPKAATTEGQA
jgi:hypothetical protein